MSIVITAFESSPDRGRGLARDMRVRWALEEAGQPYDVRLVSFAAMKEPGHRQLHPFGQIPTYEEGDLVLFESGAIVLHIAQRYPGLLPDGANARARAIAWTFAALNTVEPPIVERSAAAILERDKSWYEARLPMLDDRVRTRLAELSARLGDADWLDGAFSAADLLMVAVLRRLESTDLLQDFPTLRSYIARGEARPAYRRAFEAQLAVFTAGAVAAAHKFLLELARGGGPREARWRGNAGQMWLTAMNEVEREAFFGRHGFERPDVIQAGTPSLNTATSRNRFGPGKPPSVPDCSAS